jgi:hypothetical protein
MYEDQKVFIILVLKFFPWELLFSKEKNMSSKKKNKRKRKNGEYFFKAILCSSENLYSFKKGMNLLSVHEI